MYTIDIGATKAYDLGDRNPQLDSAAGGVVRRVRFCVVDDDSLSTSIVVKARMPGRANSTAVAVPYTKVAAASGAGAAVAAGTAVTDSDADTIFEVDETGVVIVLDVTHTSGEGSVTYSPVVG